METEQERRLFEKGEQNYKAKKALRSRSLLQETPNDEESDFIHAMWITELAYKGEQNNVLLAPSGHRPQNLILETDMN